MKAVPRDEAAGATRPRTGRAWLRPAFSDLLGLFLVILVVLIGGRRLFGDADPATHVATGAWILDHREIPRVDPFSGTRAGFPWFAHEWLADLGFAILYRACGWNGLIAAAAALVAVPHVLLFRFLVRRGDDVLAAFLAVVAAAATASSHWLARPHMVTVLFLVIVTITLEQVAHGRWRRRALWTLPPLALVWANAHGGFLILFAVVACYALGALVASLTAPAPGAPAARPLVTALALTFVASAAAVLVNPWGWRLPRHLAVFFAAQGPALQATSEFAPAASDRAGVALFVFAGLCAAALGFGLRAAGAGPGDTTAGRAHPARTGFVPFHPGTILALALTSWMAFRSIRHVEVMAIFGAIVISGGLSSLIGRRAGEPVRRQLAALREREESSGGALFALALVVVATLACGDLLPGDAGFDRAQFPVDTVAALRKEGRPPAGPVFAPDFWGGYLILEWPQARVFVDGRWDMYGDEFFGVYSGIFLARPGWPEALDARGVTLAILPRTAPLAAAMRSSEDWVLERGDGTALVFRRRGAGAPDA